MKNDDSIYMECDCGDNDHLFKLTYSEDGQSTSFPPTVYLAVQLRQSRPWCERLWMATKYVFGCESRFGHWDCTSLDYGKVKDLHRWLEQCVIGMEEHPSIARHLKIAD